MERRMDYLKSELVDMVERLARERLGAEAESVQPLIEQFYAHLAPEDMLGRDVEALYGPVVALRALARHRKAGAPNISVFNPRPDEHGWHSEHTVVQIVNDDMPFLVDSVTMALQRRDCAIHLIVHPILGVLRDATGTAVEISPGRGEQAPAESFMHIEISRQSDSETPDIARELAAALTDVRLAVDDWQPMRERMVDILENLQAPSTGASEVDLAEARDFLRWLHDDHFTFLGYRRYAVAAQAGEQPVLRTESGLGLLRRHDLHIFDTGHGQLPGEIQQFLREPRLLLITKADRVATVHRPVLMDSIGIKRFDAEGNLVSVDALIGLFTSSAYTRSPSQIPLLRTKVAYCVRRAGFRSSSHDGKALLNILESFPRDELFQMPAEQLFDTAIGILHLQERARVAVFPRRDPFGRFVTCIVYVPRDRYDTPLRLAVQSILEHAYAATVVNYYTQVGDAPLARLHFILRTAGEAVDVPVAEIEARIGEAARSWSDRLQEILVDSHGEDIGLALSRRYQRAFPMSYHERHSAQTAAMDIERVEQVLSDRTLGMSLYRPIEGAEHEIRLKLYNAEQPLVLSDVLPVLENMGLRVISEVPHRVQPAGDAVWVHDLMMETGDRSAIDIGRIREPFHETFRRVWRGDAESDGFNRLVLDGLDWRQVTAIRAYAKYLRQTGATFGQPYVEAALARNAAATMALAHLFATRFDPRLGTRDEAGATEAVQRELDNVPSADDDRILRRLLNLIDCTLRTNYYQTDADGAAKPYLSFKLDSRRIDELPLPRPMVEIFVYSPRVEGVHLRGGKVARGGIRWSDRREDFRTEVLGLMKAQTVKNTVIVPVGAKGGFVVKQPPADGGREALIDEGIACYRTFMRGLLDLTDNLTPAGCVAPANVIRRDGDDPYLVVAADKGTATFSDIANAISLEYGHWLGDAFASGGSHGYEHKAMGITARGAWVSVERHFRELGTDCRRTPFTAVGVGDMSGDVFGNGLLRSPHARLVAAFNHSHIFLDPDPDPAASFAERQRLFELPRSQWSDYDATLISPGGGVYRRDAKHVQVSPEVRVRLGIEATSLPPAELIRAILKAPVDLLFFGGIGTYVKCSAENNAAVGDRANDAIRVDGSELRARIVGEGANLAVTQLGRVEYALTGGRINTDAIDNSAGVDTSDHEVNIKILLDRVVADGDMTAKQRNELLAEMTGEVAGLVLRDNYLQTQALSLAEAQAPDLLGQFDRLMRMLEKGERLHRKVEFLPDDESLADRSAAKRGLTRPEVAVLLAYAKIWLYDQLIESGLPDDPELADNIERYFPTPLRRRFTEQIARHRLRREIVASQVTNSMVNRVGATFVSDIMERTGMPAPDVASAYIIIRDTFGLRNLWEAIEALDNKVPAATQSAMLSDINRLVDRGVIWLLRHCPQPLEFAGVRKALAEPVAVLSGMIPEVLPTDSAAAIAARADTLIQQGVPEPLARQVASTVIMASANDIGRIAEKVHLELSAAAQLYFAIGGRFDFGWLRAAAEGLTGVGTGAHWLKLAVGALVEEFDGLQRELTLRAAACGGTPEQALERWAAGRRPAIERADQLLTEVKAAARTDLAILTVVGRQLRSLAEA